MMRLILQSGLFFFLLCKSTSPYQNTKSLFHVWNVGQGQWVTHVDLDSCEHYDMGGEFAPWEQILKNCKKRKNIIYISHWDWDHLGFVRKFSKRVSQVCIITKPDGQASKRKRKILDELPFCPQYLTHQTHILYKGGSLENTSSNDRSDIVTSKNFLIPGDSSIKEEKKWIPFLGENGAQIRNLILGHHGSRTSTSDQLLQKLPKLQHAISSGRRKKYGHPHSEVVAKLSQFHIPLLLTEEWGNLHFE